MCPSAGPRKNNLKSIALILFFLFVGSAFAERPWSISSRHPVTREAGRHVHTRARPVKLAGVSALLFGFYQKYISTLDGATCYYYTTCSRYTAVAIDRYGMFKGSLMGADRLIRCHTGQTESRIDPPIDY